MAGDTSIDLKIIARIKKLETDFERTKVLESPQGWRCSRITTTPYVVLTSDGVLFVDTDGAPITVNLPVGVNGRHYIIINCGSSANNVTVTPNGIELINGVNAPVVLTDGNKITLFYNTIEGWW